MHLTSMKDLKADQLLSLFELADSFRDYPRLDSVARLDGKIIGNLFFQASTRTRLGFEVAALRLGGHVVGFSDASSTRSSDLYGESLTDAIRVIGSLVDCIVLRHHVTGAADIARSVSPVPVINAGDGWNEHPTQAIIDLWIVRRRLRSISGITFGIVGDPSARVFRSLIIGLATLKVGAIAFLPPRRSDVTDSMRSLLETGGIKYSIHEDVEELLLSCDVIDMLPYDLRDLGSAPHKTQPVSWQTPETYKITAAKIVRTQSRALILHPGPRRDELAACVDATANSVFFEQVKLSTFMRMALFEKVITTP